MAQQILVGDEGSTFNQIVAEIFKSPSVSDIHNKWRRLAMELNHSHLEVKNMNQSLLIRTQSYTDIVQDLLTEWRSREKSKATLDKLCGHFRNIEMNDIADRLLKRFVGRTDTQGNVQTSADNQQNMGTAVNKSRCRITYTEAVTPEYLFGQVYLHLYTNVLNPNTKEILEAIVGETINKLELEQNDSVTDDSISVKQRWKNLKGMVESRQGLSADSCEKFLDVLVNMDHLNLKRFSERIYLYIQSIKTAHEESQK